MRFTQKTSLAQASHSLARASRSCLSLLRVCNAYLILLLITSCIEKEDSIRFQSTATFEKASYRIDDRDPMHQFQWLPSPSAFNRMDKGGTYPIKPALKEDTARYMFYGYGIEIYTELMATHAAYNVTIDGEFLETVNVRDTANLVDQMTWKTERLEHGNHVLEISSNGGYYVLNGLEILYSPDPWAGKRDMVDTCEVIRYKDSIIWIVNKVDSVSISYKDSTIIYHKDSVVFNYIDSLIVRDTLIYDFKDTIRWDIRDSLVIDFIDSLILEYKDTLIFNYKDSTVIKTKIVRVTKPVDGFGDWRVIVSVIMGIGFLTFMILYFTKKQTN